MTESQSSSMPCPSSSAATTNPCMSPESDDRTTLTLPPLKLESDQTFAFATLVALMLEKMKRDAAVGERSENEKEVIKDWEKWSAVVREIVEVEMLKMKDADRKRVEMLVKANAPLRQAVTMFRSATLEKDTSINPFALDTFFQDHTSTTENPSIVFLILLHLLCTTLAHQLTYDARTRTLLRYLLFAFSLPPCPTLPHLESYLLRTKYDYGSSAQESQTRIRDTNKIARWTKLGLAAVGGGALIGFTGGLAAPALAGVLTGWGVGSAVASSGVITAGFTGFGAMKGAEKMSRRDADVTDFSLCDLRVRSEATVTICVSGWLGSEEDVVRPWAVLGENSCLGDVYALRWGTEAQLALGHSLQRFVRGKVVGYARNEILKRTVLVSLLGALWPLGLLKYGYIIDNPFSNAMALSDKTGLVLADLIISLPLPRRPITLVGYSLGARVIFRCLLELGRRGALGLVESAVLAGAPITPTSAEWRIAASAVSYRLVNAYSRNDWILGFLYRAASARVGVRIAGLEAIGAAFEGGQQEEDEEEEEGREKEKEEGKGEETEEEAGKQKREQLGVEVQDERVVHEVENRVRKRIRWNMERVGQTENIDLSALINGHLEYSQKMGEVLRVVGLDGVE